MTARFPTFRPVHRDREQGRVIYLDQRPEGRSPRPVQAFEFEMMAETLAFMVRTDEHKCRVAAQRRERRIITIIAILSTITALAVAHDAPAKIAATILQAQAERF